jgi:hypothetical protein
MWKKTRITITPIDDKTSDYVQLIIERTCYQYSRIIIQLIILHDMCLNLYSFNRSISKILK